MVKYTPVMKQQIFAFMFMIVYKNVNKGKIMFGRVLELYPKGYSTEDSKLLSIFLNFADGEILKEDEKIYVQADVKVEDPFGSNHLTDQRMYINYYS